MKISIFRKLLLNFGILLLLTCLVSGVGVYSLLNVKSRVEKLLTQNIELQHTAYQINNGLLQARRSEKDFLLTADPQYIGRVEEEIYRIKQGCQRLCAQAVDSEDSLRAIRLLLMVEKYHKGFISVVEKINQKWRIGGSIPDALRQKSHILEDAVKETGQKQLLINIKRPITKFKADVQQLPLDEDTKLKLMRIADEYCGLFTKIITIDAAIERLRGIYNDIAQRMGQIVQQINLKSTK